jgi:uroporphyrinogen-III synthase
MKTILYLGLRPPKQKDNNQLFIHCPLIKIVPRNWTDLSIKDAFNKIPSFSHIILTSQSAVHIFFELIDKGKLQPSDLIPKKFIVIGNSTCKTLKTYGLEPYFIPLQETQEGILESLTNENLENAHFFWPHSVLSRPILTDYFVKNNIMHHTCIIYDTYAHPPLVVPELELIDEIVFTSPSVVDAFFQFFGTVPSNKSIVTIGPITEAHLKHRLLAT